jgi:hypothetical protein
MAENNDEWKSVSIKMTDNGDVLVNGHSIIPLSDAWDKAVAETDWRLPEALIAIAQIVAAQTAHQDAKHNDSYYVELFTASLGKLYAKERTNIALAAALAPPKDKMN